MALSASLALIPCFVQAMGAEKATGKGSSQKSEHLIQSDKDDVASHSNSNTLIVIICVISFILLIVLCLIIIMLRRLKSSRKISHGSSNNNKFSSGEFNSLRPLNYYSSPDVNSGCLYGTPSLNLSSRSPRTAKGVQVFTYRELEVATEQFSERNVIGNGGYGVVYRGVLSDGTVGAIKMLRCDGKNGERAFRVEVDLLSRLHSPYLVDLLGYCADQTHRLLIFEYMPHGSLQAHLHPSSHRDKRVQCRPMDWGTRLRIALDCARALEFLHEQAALPRLTSREKVVEMVDPALNGQFSKKELIQVAAIAAVCVQAEADYRPLMTDVVQSLIPLVKNYSIRSPSSLRFQNLAVSPRC
ncbi:hypothetical protein SAY87_032124 [Trapa incisa]|uniref:Protein kinase domain-containing protein n=1 Tax=Trapa incisa TaxID=236973 RepID=A0AAN7KZ08_9MYRT|nr:hypothetical protein SAY87_032124 [Trapa incisa]